jgi:hypothetical protein
MKKSKALVLGVSFLCIFTLWSCSTTQTFLNSSVVPAAKGSVKISKDDNSNYAINVKVTNLAEPSRLQPKKKYYIVWLVTKNNVTRNIGQLKSSSGFFSSALEGKLNTVSVLQPSYIYITAENETQIQYPVGTVVLTTK